MDQVDIHRSTYMYTSGARLQQGNKCSCTWLSIWIRLEQGGFSCLEPWTPKTVSFSKWLDFGTKKEYMADPFTIASSGYYLEFDIFVKCIKKLYTAFTLSGQNQYI